ncbi:hypothetical protein CFP65_6404 [Kitasatospora sp. MMS16-BH015]|uniref:DUF2510 domain-containing protein n=1 Tax=Kitasatospora sp. MMS16-BH015 TaxID=2018025 RepID=UPI000CA1E248|nr:DUF2510 domain-containing protein [Kitasatospora sp. MMS16-BH015]AUG81060.1 hypothetical protein CFP65_6404 [Kitasatospora sp. MMS16-BH015]
MTQTAAAPGWYQDPFAPTAVRWWDGAAWTEHTQPHPQAPPPSTPPAPPAAPAAPQQAGPEALLAAPLLTFSRTGEVLDAGGTPCGSVVETGQSGPRKALRFLGGKDRHPARQFELRDATGMPLLLVGQGGKTNPGATTVSRPDGRPLGELLPSAAPGHPEFELLADGLPAGRLRADAPPVLILTDTTGTEVGRITADGPDGSRYETRFPLAEPLRSLALAAALTADTLLGPHPQ